MVKRVPIRGWVVIVKANVAVSKSRPVADFSKGGVRFSYTVNIILVNSLAG